MNEKITGKIHSIETFGLVDGPGVRFIAFMQGLPDEMQILSQSGDLAGKLR